MFSNLKFVLVGDSGVGKTTLLFAMDRNKFVSDVYPINHEIQVRTPDGKPYNYQLWDTESQEKYDRLLALTYPNTAVFLVCFSTVVPNSLEKVSEIEL